MADRTDTGPACPPTRRGWPVRTAAALLAVTCVCVATGFVWMANRADGPFPPPPEAPPAAGPFAGWPDKPAVALVLTGQTYGYTSPCGCSRPQKGGLERRANFMDGLRAKGWPVVGLDLGDVAPPQGHHSVHPQNLLKYKTTMAALAQMGYAAVGLGEYDFAQQLWELLAAYSLNNPDKPPVVLAGNVYGRQLSPDGKTEVQKFPRAQFFPGGGTKPMVEAFDVVAAPGGPPVAVVGVVGPTVQGKVEKLDKQFGFENNADVLKAALAGIAAHPAKPELKVLLYAGTFNEAKAAAAAFDQFQLVVCQSDDPEPPQFPTALNGGKTKLVQVGQKGQNVGVVGVFKAAGGFELKYQLVPMGEEYLTPNTPAAEKNNAVLQLLEKYTAEVKDRDFLKLYTAKRPLHPEQVKNQAAKPEFVATEACQKCHPGEFAVWKGSKHSHAYAALEGATRPGNQQFNGECIVCHTVGFEYQTGFENASKTPQLKNVGCENCHGPGSEHAANPKDKVLQLSMAPYKANGGGALPAYDKLKELADLKPIDRGKVPLPADEMQAMNSVTSLCMKCHDGENDPKFDLPKYMPQVWHGRGGPAPPK